MTFKDMSPKNVAGLFNMEWERLDTAVEREAFLGVEGRGYIAYASDEGPAYVMDVTDAGIAVESYRDGYPVERVLLPGLRPAFNAMIFAGDHPKMCLFAVRPLEAPAEDWLGGSDEPDELETAKAHLAEALGLLEYGGQEETKALFIKEAREWLEATE